MAMISRSLADFSETSAQQMIGYSTAPMNGSMIGAMIRLRERPEVETVWHPCFFNEETLGNTRVHSVLRQRRLNGVKGEPGLGCLLSLLLRGDSEENRSQRTEAFYDALHCLKGPSLGTPYTLCCPYTLLAHYSEMAWAEVQGVPKCLLRVSVGLEEWEVLEARFSMALEASAR